MHPQASSIPGEVISIVALIANGVRPYPYVETLLHIVLGSDPIGTCIQCALGDDPVGSTHRNMQL